MVRIPIDLGLMDGTERDSFMRAKSYQNLKKVCDGELIITMIIASAGRHETCLPSWRKSHLRARYVCLEIVWGSKDKTFLGHF